jgi:hypothetical protein
LLKTGLFRQVRELKIQRKNPGSALRLKKNVLRYMLFEVGVKSKNQSIINFKRIFRVCVCVCVYVVIVDVVYVMGFELLQMQMLLS